MIQAATTKAIEPKAPKSAKGQSPAEANKLTDGKKAEQGEFANELQASLGNVEAVEGETKVKAIEVSDEQALEKPSSLIPQFGQPESTNPKVFDPALTKGVEELIQPQSTEVAPAPMSDEAVVALMSAAAAPVATQMGDEAVMKLANGEAAMNVEGKAELKSELEQAMLKTPQVQTGGRAPAIEFAQSEVDPQLLNMEDFVAQKNLAAKKNVTTNAYGMKPQMQQAQKMALENGLKNTQVIKDATAAEGSNGSVNSQQFILNMQNEQNQNAKANQVQAPVKVFDMSQVKTSNPTQIMSQISDYIIQAKAAKEPTVNMRVNHDELGMIDITIQKSMIGTSDSVAINIGTHSLDGKNFFQQNSKDLFSHLSQAGINVSDMKVETPSQTAKNDFDFGQQSSGKQSSSQDKQFGSEQNNRRQESDRRQELWKLLNKEAA